jgi:hypothetical protein
VDRNKDQIYLTCDDGASFVMVTPPSLAETSTAAGARVSGDGKVVAFRSRSELLTDVEVSGKDEAYMYEVVTGRLEKVSRLGTACDTGAIYAKLVEDFTEESLHNMSVTSVPTSSCNYFATQGFIPSASTDGVAVGAPNKYGVHSVHGPFMSDSGRFLSFTTNFDAADTRGTLESPSLIASTAHLFLFDAYLGVTWQVTNEGVAGAAYNQMVESFCCPRASASKQRGSCSQKDEVLGMCCWQKPCFSPAVNGKLSGDGNSIVFLSDLDHTEFPGMLSNGLELFHYYIPTSTFTRITKIDSNDYKKISPTVSYAGDRVAWGSEFDWDQSGTPQIFFSEISLGCSGARDAANYLAAPDVETCCAWNAEIQPHSAGAAVATVTLTFALDQSAMIDRVPFKTAEEVDRAAFCGQVAEDAKRDVACALDIPPSLISYITSGGACAWAYDFNEAVTVELTFHQLCFGNVRGLDSPRDLAAAIVGQHSDSSSRLWRGYLTKTLDRDTAPKVLEAAAYGSDCTCACACAELPCTTTEAPTDTPTHTPTDTPADTPADTRTTDTPTDSPTDAPPTDMPTDTPTLTQGKEAAAGGNDFVGADDLDPGLSCAAFLPLAAIGFLF